MILLKIDGRSKGKGIIIHENIDDAIGDIKTYLNDDSKITIEVIQNISKKPPEYGKWLSDPAIGAF